MNLYKFYPILFIGFLFSAIASLAQVTLPEVKHIVIDKKNEIVGTYVPHGDFLRKFPDFPKDGKYFFKYSDYEIALRTIKDFEGEYYPTYEDTKFFDNNSFPAIFIGSKKKLSTDISYIIKFMGLSVYQGHRVMSIRSEDAYNLFEIKNNKNYKLDDDIKVLYKIENAEYKKEVDAVLRERGAGSVLISDLITEEYPDGELKYNDLIFDFEWNDHHCWLQKGSANWFPSFVKYSLTIKNVYGEELKKYNQIVFFESKLERRPSLYSAVDKIMYATMPSGFESLINQFLNDEDLQNKIVADNEAVSQKLKDDKGYEIYIQNKIKYAELKAKKNYLISECKSLGGSYEGIVANIDDNKKIVSKVASTTTTDSRLNAAGGLTMGLILGGMDRAEMKRNALKLEAVNAAIKDYNTEENAFISSLNNQPASTYTAQLIDEIKGEDEQLGNAMDKLITSQSNAKSGTAQAYTDLNKTYLSQLNGQMQSLRSGGNAETSAITAAGSKGTTDVCMEQATSAWKSSTEYRRYLQTKLNADASACKAKMIELTIQYCSDKLSAQELAGLRSTAASERQVEAELRKQ